MAFVATALPYVAMATSAVGSVMSAQAQRQAGNTQQALYNYNASITENQAVHVQRDAAYVANNERLQNQRLLSRQRALYAKAGVVGSTGTPLLVMAEQAATLELNALQAEYRGSEEAANLKGQAVLDRWQGGIASATGRMNANATLLTGAQKLLGQFGSYKGIG
jgi:cell division septum initiation protein DivIVA